MKLYFRDETGELRCLESAFELDLNEQTGIKRMIVIEAQIHPKSVVLSVVDGGKNA